MKLLKKVRLHRILWNMFIVGVVFSLAGAVYAQEGFTNEEIAFAIDNLTMFICAVLVLFMQAGFAMVEAGFNGGKNTINILFKNLMDMAIGGVLFFIVGYGIMYPGEFNGIFGFAGVGIPAQDALDPNYLPHYQTDFLFQVAFAATAATIVSGAVAGRMQFRSYLIYSGVITALVYPIAGSWQWGGGWLSALGFHDFAGSLIVHAVGGFAGLAGAIALGPRLGKFNADGSANPMPGHNITAATLGVFILLIGWFGFNPGSVLAMTGEANTIAVVFVAVNTFLAACTGAVAAIHLSLNPWLTPEDLETEIINDVHATGGGGSIDLLQVADTGPDFTGTYDDWAAFHGLTDQSHAGDDDNDSRTNLEEYFRGLDPCGDDRFVPDLLISYNIPTDEFTLSFKMSSILFNPKMPGTLRDGSTLVIKDSTDLGSFSAVSGTMTVGSSANGRTDVSYTDTAADPRCHFRLELTPSTPSP